MAEKLDFVMDADIETVITDVLSPTAALRRMKDGRIQQFWASSLGQCGEWREIPDEAEAERLYGYADAPDK